VRKRAGKNPTYVVVNSKGKRGGLLLSSGGPNKRRSENKGSLSSSVKKAESRTQRGRNEEEGEAK